MNVQRESVLVCSLFAQRRDSNWCEYRVGKCSSSFSEWVRIGSNIEWGKCSLLLSEGFETV